MAKRYLQKVTDGTIWTWDAQLAKRMDMREISEADFLYHQGKGPKPATVLTENIPQDIVDMLTKFGIEKMDSVRRLLNMINQDQQIMPQADLKPVEAANEEGNEEDQKPDISKDDEMDVKSIDKHISQMNKGELDAYAQVHFNKFFDLENTTKEAMKAEIYRLKAAEEGK